MKVLVIPVDTSEDVYLFDIGDDEVVQIKRAQELVKGGHNIPGYLERVRTPIESLVMYVHETGLMMHLPRNIRAEDFYPGTIVGQAFLTFEQYGEWVGIQDGVVDANVEGWFNQMRMHARSRLAATRRAL